MDHLADAPIANILILAGVIFLSVGLFGRIGGFIGSIFGNIEAGKNSRLLAGLLGALLVLGGGWMHQQGDKAAASHPSSVTPAVSPAAIVPNTSNAPVVPVPGLTATTPTSPPLRVAPVPEKNKTTAPTLAAKREDLPPAQVGRSAPASPTFDDRLIGSWTNVVPPRQIGTIARIQITRAASGLDAHIWAKCNSGECDFGIHPMAIKGNTCTFDFVHDNRRTVVSMNVYAPNILLLSGDSYEPGTSNHWRHNRVLANSNLSGTLQVAFSRYIDSPGQKAFAMTPGGAWASYRKRSTAAEAAQGALQYCQDHGWRDCRIILLNDEGPEQ